MAKIALAIAKDVWIVILTGCVLCRKHFAGCECQFCQPGYTGDNFGKVRFQNVFSLSRSAISQNQAINCKCMINISSTPLYKSKYTVLQLSVSLTFSPSVDLQVTWS